MASQSAENHGKLTGVLGDLTICVTMKRWLTTWVALALVLVAVQWAALGLFFCGLYFPPSLVTGISANMVYADSASAVVITAVNLLVFASFNAYLLIRVASKKKPLTGWRSAVPSFILTALLVALSIRYWVSPVTSNELDGPLGGIHAGMRIQGPTYVWLWGLVNAGGVVVAGVVLHRLLRGESSPRSWLVYNWAVQASLFVLLFPWLGGLP